MARKGVFLLLAVATGLSLAGSARAYQGGPMAEAIQNLFWAITFFAVLVALAVFGIMFWFLIRYRRSVSPHPTTEMEGDRRLELVWTVIPAVILIVITLISVPVLLYTDVPPKADTNVTVIGQRFSWTFQYEDGTETNGEMWIQENVIVGLDVTSVDVIHSFAVPDLGVKIDAIPGRMNRFWITATTPGDYLIQCAELCGVGHYGMRGTVHVFRAGSQPKIYGPPPKPLQVTDVELLESGGNATKPWSIAPRNLTFAIGSRLTLRVWNNNSAAHDFRIDAPVNESVPAIAPFGHAWLNFTLNATSVTPVPYGPANATDRGSGMEGALTIQSGEVIVIDLDDANAGAGHTWSVSPSPLKLDLGETYTFEIRNIGSIPHNFTMLGSYSNIRYDALISPGGVAFAGPFTVTQNASGHYQCNVPGHASAGMTATYITGTGSVAEARVPLFDMTAITIAVSGPVTLAYVIHHARRPED